MQFLLQFLLLRLLHTDTSRSSSSPLVLFPLLPIVCVEDLLVLAPPSLRLHPRLRVDCLLPHLRVDDVLVAAPASRLPGRRRAPLLLAHPRSRVHVRSRPRRHRDYYEEHTHQQRPRADDQQLPVFVARGRVRVRVVAWKIILKYGTICFFTFLYTFFYSVL